VQFLKFVFSWKCSLSAIQVFVDQIFRIFDKDGNGSIDFKVSFSETAQRSLDFKVSLSETAIGE
jgi:hypothetical protein